MRGGAWSWVDLLRSRALLSIPSGRLRRLNLAPAVHRFSHGGALRREVVGGAHRILKIKDPRRFRDGGLLFLGA